MIDGERVLSLFSGIEGLGLGLERAGMRVVGQVEIDPFCIRVNTKNFPGVARHGDVQTYRGERGSADVVCGGSPCQDISVAGKRAGLAGERSRLFHDFVRIADEVAPEWLLFENVDSLLSSHDGRDFQVVLRELTGFEPQIPSDGWRSSGVCRGPRRAVAWRLFDSQYFGVAQRRHRLFVVGHARAGRAFAVLHEPESCSGDRAPRDEEAAIAAGDLARSVGSVGGGDDVGANKGTIIVAPSTAAPLRAEGHDASEDGTGRQPAHIVYSPRVAGPLLAEGYNASEDGGQLTTKIVEQHMPRVAYSLRASEEKQNGSPERGDMTLVTQRVAHTLMGSGGPGMKSSPSRMMDEDVNLVAFRKSQRARNAEDSETWVPAKVANTMNTFDDGDIRATELVVEHKPFSFQPRVARNGRGAPSDVVPALAAESGTTSKGDSAPMVVDTEWRVRRLTITERERLQGFPDGWTHLCGVEPYSSMTCKCPDGPRARALGNAVTVNVAAWIGRRMKA